MTVLHVLPVDDLIEHEEAGDECPCGVDVEYCIAPNGTMRRLVLHHSLDGRELTE